MIRVLGSSKTLCDRVSRRDMLRVGSLGTVALSLPDLLREDSLGANVAETARAFGSAKRVILLYLYGAAAQHERDLTPLRDEAVR